ncbi:MAG: Holliday junction resolvase RuvX [Acidobacteria bacterium]|nr:Holliday junction resolvase RuvX [Acidobacteriota bacterium]
MQEKEIPNSTVFTDVSKVPRVGRLVALDPGTMRIGIAVCDELQITTTPLPRIERKSWKNMLLQVKETIAEFDAKALVIGLPLESNGDESDMSREAREMARKFNLSLDIPVFLQDERVTSYEAKRRLWADGASLKETRRKVDSRAAAILLADFLDRLPRR